VAQWLSVALLVVLSSAGCWLLPAACCLLVAGCMAAWLHGWQAGWQKVRTQAAVFVVPATCVPHHMVATTTLRPRTEALFSLSTSPRTNLHRLFPIF